MAALRAADLHLVMGLHLETLLRGFMCTSMDGPRKRRMQLMWMAVHMVQSENLACINLSGTAPQSSIGNSKSNSSIQALRLSFTFGTEIREGTPANCRRAQRQLIRGCNQYLCLIAPFPSGR